MDRTAEGKPESGPQPGRYGLFSSPEEHARYAINHEIFGEFTQRTLLEAGIREGMSVLDLGCGPGLVSFMVASIVGSRGCVVGLDKNPKLLDLARERAAAEGASTTRFVEGDLDAPGLPIGGDRFDAIVERLVLFAVADPAETIRRVSRALKPGGVFVMLEFDNRWVQAGQSSWPRCELLEHLSATWLAAARRTGIHLDVGINAFSMTVAAGLTSPELRMHAPIGGGPDFVGYKWYAMQNRLFEAQYIELGLVRPGELQVETLAERLRREAIEKNAFFMVPPMIACWARRPD
jgi:ubiquinone/menaquinone biosynthesis C-methylase UbiE